MSEQEPAGNPVSGSARAAARRLAQTHGPGLEAQVEAALHARRPDRQPDQYFDPLTLGSLIVSAAALSWTIYKDLHNKTPHPPREIITRRVRVELPASYPARPAERDELIKIVVEEIVKSTEE
jgi:hypothetical protein